MGHLRQLLPPCERAKNRPCPLSPAARSRTGRPCSQYLLRVDYGDPGVALKVADIEGQDPTDSVDDHRRHEPGVMSVLAANLVVGNQLLPLGKDSRCVIQEGIKSL